MQTKEEEVQHKVVLFQLLQQHVEQLKQQAQLLEQQSLETEMTHQALGNITKLKEGSDILLPFGSGMYGPGKSARSDSVLVNVGANVIIRKPVSEASRIIENRKKELEEAGKKMQESLQETLAKMQQIAEQVQEYQADQESKEAGKWAAE